MKLNHPIYGEIEIKTPIKIKSNSFTITNVYPLGYDPYNTPYEGINWSETNHYYPPGQRYLNPYQRKFLPIKTYQLKFPSVYRISSTPLTTYSVYNRNPPIISINQ